MALLSGTITLEDGTVCATCEHHKVHLPTRPEHLEQRVSWDERWEGGRWKGEGEKGVKGVDSVGEGSGVGEADVGGDVVKRGSKARL